MTRPSFQNQPIIQNPIGNSESNFARSIAKPCPLGEPRGLLPSGGLASPTGREPHQTREPRGLSPSGGKTPASIHVSRAPCAPMARSPGSRGTTPCASREARCRAAVWPRQPAGSRTRPASRGTLRATAVNPRPAFMSPEHPARLRRAARGQGVLPLARAARPVAERR